MKALSEDDALELEIETARRVATAAAEDGDSQAAREYFAAMNDLIMQRSSKQIAKMELERGLRAP